VENERKYKLKISNLKFALHSTAYKFCLAIIISAIILAGCGKKEHAGPKEPVKAGPEQSASGKPEDQVQHKVLSFNLEGLSDKGAKKWDVTGESAESVSEKEVKMANIVANAYGEEAQATITADKGVYDKSKNNVRLEENVKATIESTEGFSGQFVDMSNVTGPQKSGNPVPGKKEKTKTVITCDAEVQFDYEQNQAYFSKNVKVISEDGSIKADKITVYLDPATKRVKEIVAEGNVCITRGENITYSDKATYVEADKKIILIGKPRLVIYQEGGIEGALFTTDLKGAK
jgi:lipopolysaccharide export system protein LptA